VVKHSLRALWRWCALAWRHYLDDLARMLVGDFEVIADGHEEMDPWYR
jgi:hypothetical protein